MSERKLTVIMFTDMVGYSKKMQEDEDRALLLLRHHDEILESQIETFKGEVIKTIGDAFFARFDSVDQAVDCAATIQKQIAKRNKLTEADNQFEVRIGIHVGDVIYRDKDIFGDGVNVAARIESKAGPSEILVSQEVYSIAQAKGKYPFVARGAADLKNISRPVHIYEVIWDPDSTDKMRTRKIISRPASVASTKKHLRPSLATGFLVLLIVGAGLYYIKMGSPSQKIETFIEPPTDVQRDRPALAVFPFYDETGLEDFARISMGKIIQDAVIQQLYEFTKVRLLSPVRVASVIKNHPASGDSIAKDLSIASALTRHLGGNLLVSGGLKKIGEKLVLQAQLNDISTEQLVFSSVLQVTSGNALLDSLIEKFTGALKIKLSSFYSLSHEPSPDQVTGGITKSLEAYSHYVKGTEKYIYGELEKAADEMLMAVKLDPEFATALSELSCIYSYAKQDSLADVYGRRAREMSDKMRGTGKEVLIFKGNSAWFEGNKKDTEKYYSLITDIYPDDRDGYLYLGTYYLYMDEKPTMALEVLNRALKLSPDYFPIWRDLSFATSKLKGEDEAVKMVQEYMEKYPGNPGIPHARRWIATLRGVSLD